VRALHELGAGPASPAGTCSGPPSSRGRPPDAVHGA
jgi:hypothetical protein